jgi:hypothetical protein
LKKQVLKFTLAKCNLLEFEFKRPILRAASKEAAQ